MNSIEKLIILCQQFKKNAFGIKEFQQKIEEILLPDMCKYTLEKEQYNACNKLEEIIYCYKESRKLRADQVAEELLQAALAEQKRLENYKPYQT